MDETPDRCDSTGLVIRWLDVVIVALIRTLIALSELKSRDPREHPARLLKADPHERTRIRNWQGVLEWSPRKRVGCFAGVLVGVAIGGAVLWYGLN
jgi:hypothetical protein